ncbi:MAG: TetR/AcrR family transcriptional regulator [Sphingobacteriales bacterium]|nr:MAG: TetR/AcrR family transcriptional regulator [Sphingobacteriales bacterium]
MKVNILEKATELFTRQGIRSVTMDDVSKHLSISKKTLYQHFTNKDDLVETIVKAQVKITEQNCVDFRKKAENAVE